VLAPLRHILQLWLRAQDLPEGIHLEMEIDMPKRTYPYHSSDALHLVVANYYALLALGADKTHVAAGLAMCYALHFWWSDR
jgi:hypothetical protein